MNHRMSCHCTSLRRAGFASTPKIRPRALARAAIVAAMGGVLAAPSAHALVMCKKGSGVVVLRDACRSREVAVDSAEVAVALTCPPDAVRVGTVCVDKYEASVWSIDSANTDLIEKVQSGDATLADLTAAGATQIAPAGTCSPNFPITFPASGNWSAPLYAASIPGVHPTTCVDWYQAQQLCALSGKRLLTNEEWQRAAAGTPDPPTGADDGSTECNTLTAGHAVDTASRSACVSRWGAFDMVGNVGELVADWADRGYTCANWTTINGPNIPGDDESCFGGPGASDEGATPAVLIRGGDYAGGKLLAGVFMVYTSLHPPDGVPSIGFRCAR